MTCICLEIRKTKTYMKSKLSMIVNVTTSLITRSNAKSIHSAKNLFHSGAIANSEFKTQNHKPLFRSCLYLSKYTESYNKTQNCGLNAIKPRMTICWVRKAGMAKDGRLFGGPTLLLFSGPLLFPTPCWFCWLGVALDRWLLTKGVPLLFLQFVSFWWFGCMHDRAV